MHVFVTFWYSNCCNSLFLYCATVIVRYRISHAPRSQSPLAMQSWQHKCKRNTTQTIAHKMLLLVNTPDRCALCSLHSPACTHLNQNLALLGLTQRYIHTWAWQWNTHQIWDMNEIRLNRQWPCLHYVFIVWEEVFTWCFQSTVNCYSEFNLANSELNFPFNRCKW